MYVVNVLLGAIFCIIAFALNKYNARYVLSGYNTLSEEERKQFDLKNYLRFFKRFFLTVGMAIMVGFFLLDQLVDTKIATAFTVLFPLIALFYFMISSSRFNHNPPEKKKSIALIISFIIIGISIIGSTTLLVGSILDNKITFEEKATSISGFYGEDIPYLNIIYLDTVNTLPAISYRANGIALGSSCLKGYFKTRDRNTVKLLINEDKPPYIQLKTNNDQSIFFNASNPEQTKSIYDKLRERVMYMSVK